MVKKKDAGKPTPGKPTASQPTAAEPKKRLMMRTDVVKELSDEDLKDVAGGLTKGAECGGCTCTYETTHTHCCWAEPPTS